MFLRRWGSSERMQVPRT